MKKENLNEESPITLFCDDSPQSAEALRLLRIAKIPFRKVIASGDDLPSIELGGCIYPMLEEVSRFARVFKPEYLSKENK